ncbi:MAG: metal-sulfur cluster assembly factor [Leptospiraceae bacterium]|nr:metal-sulfur cluster assembly factor [Leptospiraceae bacterium]MCB1170875.1 metal-sulfur cluster assembly factor [Leptospiraceae bacterium]
MAEETQNPRIDASAEPATGVDAPANHGVAAKNDSGPSSTEADGPSNENASSGSTAGTIDQLWTEIGTVADPEIGIAITELGLVYDVQVDGNKATVTMTLTSMGCPVGPQIQAAVQGACSRVEGIEDAEVEIVFSPPWNPREMASEEAQMMLGLY